MLLVKPGKGKLGEESKKKSVKKGFNPKAGKRRLNLTRSFLNP